MKTIFLEVLVLELAGVIKINGKKVLPGEKGVLEEKIAKELEKEGLIEILGESEKVEVEVEKETTPEGVEVAPITASEGQTLTEEKPADLPVVETKTETTPEKVEVAKTDIEAEANRLVKEHTFKELADYAKSIGLTKTV